PGAAPRGRNVPPLQLPQGARAAPSDRAAGAGPVHQPGSGADAADKRREPGADDRPPVRLSDGLARLLRHLPNRSRPAQPGGMGATPAALADLGALAHRPAALPRAAAPRDQRCVGGHHGSLGARARPVAAQPASRPPGRSLPALLRRTWPSPPDAGRRMTPPPNRRVRTRTHGGVGGVELRGFPLSRLNTDLWKMG